MPDSVHVFNPTDGPVLLDLTGRTLGGGEWADVPSSPQVRAALDSGRLIEPPAATDTTDSEES